MNSRSKQIVFTILSVLLVGVSDCLTFNRCRGQTSEPPNTQRITPQLTQSNPTVQPPERPSSQLVIPFNLQPQQVITWSKQYPTAIVVTVVVALYLGVLGLRPAWVLLLPLDKIPKIGPIPEIPIPSAIASFLKYRPRVLDAWVSQRIIQAQETFENRPTVKDRKIHIPIPVELNGSKPAIANFSVNDLRGVFSKQFTRLLIVGEGGVGKTSLACQIARWAMADQKAERLCKHRILPVLIEEELEEVGGKSPLLEAIARQIKNLRDDEKPVSEELLKQLLEKRRILVMIQTLNDENPGVRDTVMIALQGIGRLNKIGPYTQSASLALAEIIENGDVDDRRGACFALKNICSVDKEELVVPNLIKALHDIDQLVRVLAAHLLMRLKPGMTQDLVSNLIDMLKSDDPTVRCYVCIAIRDSNWVTQETISVLKGACNDSEEIVRQAASESLRKFGV